MTWAELQRAGLQRAGQTVMKPAPAALHGLVDALLATAVNVAFRQATVYVSQGVGKLLGKAVEHPTQSKLAETVERTSRSR